MQTGALFSPGFIFSGEPYYDYIIEVTPVITENNIKDNLKNQNI